MMENFIAQHNQRAKLFVMETVSAALVLHLTFAHGQTLTSEPTTFLAPPSKSPSSPPTSSYPTTAPTAQPTESPTSSFPTASPTSSYPTTGPTVQPTESPTTSFPTAIPTSNFPTDHPTDKPSTSPTQWQQSPDVESDWPDCTEAPKFYNNLKSACGIDDIVDISESALSFEDGEGYCNYTCTNALSSLVLSVVDCSTAEKDTLFNVSDSESVINDALLRQSMCTSPSTNCIGVILNLNNYLKSTDGQTCESLRKDAQLETASGVAQAKSRAYCHSTCGKAIQPYLSQLNNHGCSSWNAYNNIYRKFYGACSKSLGRYCSGFTLEKYRDSIDVVLAGRSSIEVSDRLLNPMCNSCFYEYLRMENRYGSTSNDWLKVLEKICTRDGDRFCYPRFVERQAATANSLYNDRARSLCDLEFMGRCANKMQLRDYLQISHIPSEQSRAEQILTDVDSMCLVDPSSLVDGGNGTLCADVMAPVVGGYDFSAGIFSGQRYQGPTQCSNVEQDSDCSWSCQREFTAERDDFGCCYQSMRSSFQSRNIDVDSVFNRSDTLANECNRPALPECAQVGVSSEASLLVEVPMAFTSTAQDISQLALNDAVRATGLSPSFVQIKGFRFNTDSTTWIDIILLGRSKEELDAIVSDINQAQSARNILNFDVEYAYYQR